MRRQRVVASSEAFVSFATLGELATGVFRVIDPAQEAARIRAVLGSAVTLLPTERTATHFGRITASLQRQGRPIPINDVWNAALALEHDIPLLVDDAHFARVPGLQFISAR